MTRIERFEEIEAWQTARELTRQIYSVSNQGAFSKDFALRDQMRRATVSIMSNIAEGFESRTEILFWNSLAARKVRQANFVLSFMLLEMLATLLKNNSDCCRTFVQSAVPKSAVSWII